MLYLYNTLSRNKEEFKPLRDNLVGLYTCGPTVYESSHIGHMRQYVVDDILQSALEINGHQVKKVMNITDVGHMTSDGDWGEDKVDLKAQKENLNPLDIARKYEDEFFSSLNKLKVRPPDVVCRASEHIESQINLIKLLQKKGLAYKTEKAIYFDVSKFPRYTTLSKQDLEEKMVGVRQDVYVDPEKRNNQDFVLWYFLVGRYKNHILRWSSPWGEGFPGWHIECSAMSMEYLGETIDIHRGGVDHIPVHHTNEIAQSEGATGKQFVRFWIHHEFVLVEGEKMSKSKQNFYRVADLEKKGHDPLSLRYLFMQTHYRKQLNFTWESLESAERARAGLREKLSVLLSNNQGHFVEEKDLSDNYFDYLEAFTSNLEDDLNTPRALGVMWNAVKDEMPDKEKQYLLQYFDKTLRLDLFDDLSVRIPVEIKDLAEQRFKYRKMQKYAQADELRSKIQELGYEVFDTEEGYELKPKLLDTKERR